MFFNKNGFTIVEMIVVVAVFLFVVGAGMGVFVSVIREQRNTLAEQQLLNQISYIEEYMSKALRMAKTDQIGSCLGVPGYIYLLTQDVGSGAYRGIKFINQSDNDACQEFFLDDSDPNNVVLKELKNDTNYNNAVAISSNNMDINFMRFIINGSDSNTYARQCSDGDQWCIQPKVTILLNVTISGNNNEPSRTIQTTVSRRNLNILQ